VQAILRFHHYPFRNRPLFREEAAKMFLEEIVGVPIRKLRNWCLLLIVGMCLEAILIILNLFYHHLSSMYYKMKLQFHNFTIYELGTSDNLYVWNESEGGVTSNEFTSCVISFIVRKLNTHKYKEFILISDGLYNFHNLLHLENYEPISQMKRSGE